MARAEKTVVLNVRVTENQAKWLRNVAEDQHSGNLSEAVRQAITDSWILRRVREEYKAVRAEEGFEFPRDEHGLTRPIEVLLGGGMFTGVTVTWDEDDAKWV
jgi:Arc/MetJ-type ribon-helix-helix transcriptional regulator